MTDRLCFGDPFTHTGLLVQPSYDGRCPVSLQFDVPRFVDIHGGLSFSGEKWRSGWGGGGQRKGWGGGARRRGN